MLSRMLLATTAASFIAGSAFAAEEFAFDQSHTHILFQVDHLGMSTIHGEFVGFEGTFMLDREDPANSSLDITIDVASMDTGYADRDGHFLSADFFEVETYPTASFVSTAVEVTGDNTATVTGDLTIKDITNEVTLDVTLNGIMDDHPLIDGTQPLAGFSARGTVLRSAWGMDIAVPFVADEVDLVIETETIGPAS